MKRLTLPTTFRIRTGCLLEAERAVLICEDEARSDRDETFTPIAVHDLSTGWQERAVDWNLISVCAAQVPVAEFVAVGQTGDYAILGHRDEAIGNLFDDLASPTPDASGAVVRAVGAIDGRAYTVGMRGLALRRDHDRRWRDVAGDQLARHDLEAIAGFHSEEIYAVGWKGAICRFDGAHWHTIASPTNRVLTAVCCARDGTVYCCGQDSLLLEGRNDRWRAIDQDETAEDFWDLAWFKDRLYVSSMTSLFQLVDRVLEPVTFDITPPLTCGRLSAADGWLWSIGARHVVAFDGTGWTEIVVP